MAAVQSHRYPDVLIDQQSQLIKNDQPINLSLTPQVIVTQKKPSAAEKVDQYPLVANLKGKVAELTKKNENLEKQVNDMKMSTKVCVYNELDAQLEIYTKECQRLRQKLEKVEVELVQTKK